MSDEYTDSDDSSGEQALEELDGIVRDEDGRLRARMEVSANAGRVPEEYQ
jgi:hypothetical protein